MTIEVVKVVQHGRHKERDHGDQRQQFLLFLRGNMIRDKHETAMGIDQLHGYHRPDQEYKCLGDLSDTIQNLMLHDEPGTLFLKR